MPRLEPSASSGGVRSRHRSRGGRVSTALAEINVVPLVDVMLVLLVIFMVTAPMMQQGFDVKLPQTRRAPATTSEPVFVTVTLDFHKTRRVQIGDDPAFVDLQAASERVRQAILNTPTKSVILRGDGGVVYADLMQVMDALLVAGVTQVSLATQPYTPDK
jgi:biopolymer transport protein ExbD